MYSLLNKYSTYTLYSITCLMFPLQYVVQFYTLLKKFQQISQYVIDDANAKLYVTKKVVKQREMVEHLVTWRRIVIKEIYLQCIVNIYLHYCNITCLFPRAASPAWRSTVRLWDPLLQHVLYNLYSICSPGLPRQPRDQP